MPRLGLNAMIAGRLSRIPLGGVVVAGSDDMAQPDELATLAESLCAGQPEAWEKLYILTHLPLLRMLRRVLGNEVRAEEALQAAYVTAIEKINTFDAKRGAVDSWLAGIARRKGLELARSESRHGGKAMANAVGLRLVSAASGEPAQDGELVELALDQLEPRYAEMLRRKYLKEQSIEEIAAELQLNPATVGTWLHRARERFREIYQRLQSHGEQGK